MPPRCELVLLLVVCHLVGLGLASWPRRISQQPDNDLVDFGSYRHIAIVHFDVPENVVSAGFKFIAREAKTGGIGDCYPRNVTLNIKSGSLPLVSPDGSRIAAKLLGNRRRHYSIEALSNGDEHIVNIVAPPPGSWYVIAYRSWTDPNTGKIKQQGIGASCETVLNTELLVETPDHEFLLGESDTDELTAELLRPGDTAMMQFRVPPNHDESSLIIRSSCGDECAFSVHITAGDLLLGQLLNSSENEVEFRPYDDGSLHYVTLRHQSGKPSNVTVSLEAAASSDTNLTEVRLTRKSLPDFFLFDYEHLVGNSTKPTPMNVTAGNTSVLRFKVGSIRDTGGTLSIWLRISELEKDRKDHIVVVGCVTLGYYSPISSMGNCLRTGTTNHSADLFVANRTSPAFVHVPFPEPGLWHLTVQAYCLEADDGDDDDEDDDDDADGALYKPPPCECFEQCARNGTDCEGCDCVRECDARVESSISSSPCIEGGCGPHGRCFQYTSGGIIFSGCTCMGGWRGFDCADDEYVLSKADVLSRLLLLTLSNLAFVGAIYVAIRRFYYTEAIVYAAVMFFSTFYHACEAGEEGHSFCLMKLNVLQFCDFYNALLSIWVTLVAMASMGPRTTSFCQMLGVVVLAVGAEMDRTALWVFLLPAVSGCAIVILSWAFKCRQKGTLQYPARVYRLMYLPIGLIVVFVGLVCYAFLQTRSNYYIVHSLWHICVAAGVILLLPKREYMK